ncbi:hypothetical protein HNR23_003748 [Nocardiopsis mwathae]|uniref:Uncharacterized protein n=1 Tax=Nocardiopsis mwathae TaxID=1472723 RepID=A0A7W9YK56_9ACTN|nr:hypothetical protein [Nocardiopsis mwathae]MBB6173682.1 hypothetical protein [Nocardiopsis mwathae]MBB6173688.1 hypothetical protein [Nocardiopsis mwathae]
MNVPLIRVGYGDVTVTYDPCLPPLQRFTVRWLGGRIVRLRAPRAEAHRALVRECRLPAAVASRLLDQAQGLEP